MSIHARLNLADFMARSPVGTFQQQIVEVNEALQDLAVLIKGQEGMIGECAR